jgi:DNA-binding response OmpR family regulator
MKLLTFIHRCDLERPIADAFSSNQFVVETATSAKECVQLTRLTQYEGVLVDSESVPFAGLVALIRLLRQENSGAALFVFARQLATGDLSSGATMGATVRWWSRCRGR